MFTAAGSNGLRVTNTGDRPLRYEVSETRSPAVAGTRAQPDWRTGIAGSTTNLAMGVDQSTGNVWVVDNQRLGHEYRSDGTPTGRVIPTVPDSVPGDAHDLAYDPVRKEMCVQMYAPNPFDALVTHGGISCFSPATGQPTWSIFGVFPWIRSNGLAYRPDTDTFYLAESRVPNRRVFQIAGRSRVSPGSIVGSCALPAWNADGLAWHPGARELFDFNTLDHTVMRIEPDGCGVLGTIALPGPELPTMELDAQGRLWTMSLGRGIVSAIETGLPMAADQPWLSVSNGSGYLAPGTPPPWRSASTPRGWSPVRCAGPACSSAATPDRATAYAKCR